MPESGLSDAAMPLTETAAGVPEVAIAEAALRDAEMGDRGWLNGVLAPSLRYFYFIRFSVLLWLFPVVFLLLDASFTTTLSRGMWVPERWQGYACVAFFLVATGFVALITARTVVINGAERFSVERPDRGEETPEPRSAAPPDSTPDSPPFWLHKLLVNETSREEHRAVLIALLPALVAFAYAMLLAYFERVPHGEAALGLLLGTVLAGLFWYVVNACYYLAYERCSDFEVNEPLRIGFNAARTILFPRRWLWLKMPGEGILAGGPPHTLEDITTTLRRGWFASRMQRLVGWMARKWKLPGYMDQENGRLYEAQLFAIIASGGFLLLFLVLYPLTAPGRTIWAELAITLVLLMSLLVAWVIGSGQFPIRTRRNDSILLAWKLGLAGCAMAFSVTIFLLWWFSAADRFPILASLLLMMILLGWGLGAAAFALDRFRIPVLTLLIVLFLLPRLFHLYERLGPSEEHYLSTTERSPSAVALPTPAEVVSAKLAQAQDDGPLVIVTATGGGLHASAWTTQVLRQLYLRLAERDNAASQQTSTPQSQSTELATSADYLNRHLLLMSTVSGGSVGLKYFLTALHGGLNERSFSDAVVAAQCSSLESVGWGLAYYDLPRALVFGLPYLWWPSSGEGDLTRTPMGKDRTWALRRAWERNEADHYCWLTSDRQVEAAATPQVVYSGPRARARDPLTLGDLPPASGFPAFTMNSTAAEMGSRFLLANYRLPHYPIGRIESGPAESFLDIFEAEDKPDMPLATAAQMSATFPYVSSAARFPERYTRGADSAHFVDGGYYDNDGTASAIEFLRYALDEPGPIAANDPKAADDVRQGQALHAAVKQKGRLKILLIEIRNSIDQEPRKEETPEAGTVPLVLHPGGKGSHHVSGVLDQAGFPAAGLWNAGHNSVTGRNRNGLDLLVESHPDSLALRQIIFDDQTDAADSTWVHPAKDPLSWSLTPRQRAEVVQNVDRRKYLQNCYNQAAIMLKGGGDWAGAASPLRCRK